MGELAKLPAAERAAFGKRANEAKTAIEAALADAQSRLENAALARRPLETLRRHPDLA